MQADLIEDVLCGPAQMFGGSRLGDEELIQLACEEFKGQSFCIVRNWMMLDLLLSDTQEREVRKQGLQPTVLFINHAVFDNEARVQTGDGFITGYQKDFHGCFFESEDALYILAGRGARKHVSLPAFQALSAYANVGITA
ncbi:hypothetical protein SAMN04490202_0869 [Pseudomonas reinekei]|uniref:DUF6957 domain-containing protein n=1 Tax=Pseudomonas reinekei TaxID=395598 RepID=A0A1H0JHF8_PSERE|nr:hypothetical protein [Pseudomonas reinekei]KAB0483857.1 hypothetical protein F7R15_19605 [Pseudomonas reinekei]OLU00921.1 hypothetical protein BVK86_20565 [Pseudomonas reinekei]SDO43146.1 hypothetical protein SAMN04490202_0869 [Pseudomonas reinekei]